MDWSRYPDPGGVGSDRERLEFAVHFATTQRASSAARVYNAVGANPTEHELHFLAVDAFEEKMQAVEDTLGWIHVLRTWVPDGRSLFKALDRVRVEREEEGLQNFLTALDEQGLRDVLRVRDEDLAAAGLAEDLRSQIVRASSAWLSGLRRLLEYRTTEDRRRVQMFNKSKHMLQAVLKHARRGDVTAIDFISGDPSEPVGRIIATQQNVRTVAAETVVFQAVLHGMLACILMTHYDVEYVTPSWVAQAYRLPEGWYDGPEVEQLLAAVR